MSSSRLSWEGNKLARELLEELKEKYKIALDEDNHTKWKETLQTAAEAESPEK
jgi:hypothetical protein